MKTLKYILILGSFITVSFACNKDLNVLPQNAVSPGQIKTSADVEALLFGAYEGLQQPGGFGEGFIFETDLIASDSQLVFVGTFQDYQAAANLHLVSTNVISPFIWGGTYSIINICNTVLDKISLVDSADWPTVTGEAKFIRGTCYFYLAGIFCKPWSDGNAATNPGVPVVLQPTYTYDSSSAKPSRGTLAQTYAQAIADLDSAANDLPTSQPNFRATSYSAMAILSRVYLSMGDYTDAAIQANNVISSGAFALNGTFDKCFNNDGNSQEDIFGIQQSIQSNAGTVNNGISTFYAPASIAPAGRGDAYLDSNYLSFFGPSDFRSTFFTTGNGLNSGTEGFTNKWIQFFKTIPVVRLSEMYLTRGESNLLTGGSLGDTPQDDINAVRGRAGASSLTAVTQQNFIDERFRELAYEGDRYWTLKRVHRGVGGLSFDDIRLIYPIPQSELDVNKNLIQNQ